MALELLNREFSLPWTSSKKEPATKSTREPSYDIKGNLLVYTKYVHGEKIVCNYVCENDNPIAELKSVFIARGKKSELMTDNFDAVQEKYALQGYVNIKATEWAHKNNKILHKTHNPSGHREYIALARIPTDLIDSQIAWGNNDATIHTDGGKKHEFYQPIVPIPIDIRVPNDDTKTNDIPTKIFHVPTESLKSTISSTLKSLREKLLRPKTVRKHVLNCSVDLEIAGNNDLPLFEYHKEEELEMIAITQSNKANTQNISLIYATENHNNPATLRSFIITNNKGNQQICRLNSDPATLRQHFATLTAVFPELKSHNYYSDSEANQISFILRSYFGTPNILPEAINIDQTIKNITSAQKEISTSTDTYNRLNLTRRYITPGQSPLEDKFVDSLNHHSQSVSTEQITPDVAEIFLRLAPALFGLLALGSSIAGISQAITSTMDKNIDPLISKELLYHGRMLCGPIAIAALSIGAATKLATHKLLHNDVK